MDKFMAIYKGSANSDEREAFAQDAERLQKGMDAWGRWMQDHADVIVAAGGPLGKTKRVDASGVGDITNDMTGYVIVNAESHEAAAKLFENHPHFAIFPGDCVEIMTCPPIPGA